MICTSIFIYSLTIKIEIHQLYKLSNSINTNIIYLYF